MQDKTFDAINEQTRQFFEPMRKLNSLMLQNMERVSEYQMESLKRYSQMGTERLRDATEITDADSLRDFGTRQAEMMNELSQQMLEDARTLGEMSLKFKAELEQLYTESGQAFAEQAGQAAKPAATAKPEAEKPATAEKPAPAKSTSQAARKHSGGSAS
ncbi:phasin family protein [Halomonas getboli]|uniref:phasin family protein n=1 Tax=Halomonas getboli TaxID=2935862 RepID=UPI001FFE3DE2|nr:phasin family protein [Halomonas getboli]MCK2185583.1 phasin family protein [Halomonas getboli]